MTSKVVGITDNVFINPWLIVGIQLLIKTLQSRQKWVWVALLPGLYSVLQYSGQNAGSAQYNLLPSILSAVYLYFNSWKCFSTMLELWTNLLGCKNGWVHSRGRSCTVVSVQFRSTWMSRVTLSLGKVTGDTANVSRCGCVRKTIQPDPYQLLYVTLPTPASPVAP